MKIKITAIGICCVLLLGVAVQNTKAEKPLPEMPTENISEVEETVKDVREIVVEPTPEPVAEEPIEAEPITEEPVTEPELIIEQPTTPQQPTEPQGGSVNEYGQVYVPGFGWLTDEGPNKRTVDYNMRMNGNKVGIM